MWRLLGVGLLLVGWELVAWRGAVARLGREPGRGRVVAAGGWAHWGSVAVGRARACEPRGRELARLMVWRSGLRQPRRNGTIPDAESPRRTAARCVHEQCSCVLTSTLHRSRPKVHNPRAHRPTAEPHRGRPSATRSAALVLPRNPVNHILRVVVPQRCKPTSVSAVRSWLPRTGNRLRQAGRCRRTGVVVADVGEVVTSGVVRPAN